MKKRDGSIEGENSLNIIYLGPFSYPSSNANSLRVKGVVDALAKAGNKITVCPGVLNTGKNDDAINVQHQNIRVYQLDEYAGGIFSNLKRGFRGLFLGDLTIRWLKTLSYTPDAIVLYGSHLGYASRLMKYCRSNNIKLYFDIVEWYDPRHLPGGLFGPFAISNEYSMRWVVPHADGIIVISHYLENYYRAKGCKTILIPPIFSKILDEQKKYKTSSELNLCYVGTPGKKEAFDIVFEGIIKAIALGVDIKMHIVGVTENEFHSNYPLEASLFNGDISRLLFYGRLGNNETKNIVSNSDFLLLARRPLRFANAGFPFKVSESMTLGTPVITNNFSDILKYLVHGVNSILLKNLSSDEIARALLFARSLSSEEFDKMQINARNTASNFFSVDSRFQEISNFFRVSIND